MYKATVYKKESPVSYALGAALAVELLKTCPERCRAVLLHPDFSFPGSELEALCNKQNVSVSVQPRAVEMLSRKENCYAVSVFEKMPRRLSETGLHAVLVDPADMGNLGTVMRACAAFGAGGLVLIGASADWHHPKTVRASMGAYFHVKTAQYPTFDDYQKRCGVRAFYPFFLTAQTPLTAVAFPPQPPISLVFGNESSGLPGSFSKIGTPLRIEQTSSVDSLSLPMAVTVALFWAARSYICS